MIALMGLFLCVASVTPVDAANIDERLNYVEIDLFQELLLQDDDNLVVSPASLKAVLTALAAGLGGRTSSEVRALLRLPSDQESIIAAAKRSLAPFKIDRVGAELELATRLWTGSDVQVIEKYRQTLIQNYDSDIQRLEFGDVIGSAKTINDWVNQHTRGKIQSIVTPGSLSPGTKLMLTNALYLKGNWKRAFNRNLTSVKCFHVPNHGCQNTYLMQSLGYYKYAYVPGLAAHVVELLYADEGLSMMIFLPENADDGINGIARDLAHTSLPSIYGHLEEMEVLLHLPRFTIDMKLDLRPALERLGVRDLFNLNANMAGIVEGAVEVDSILHNAKIEVNEEGTVAAAVTAAAVVPLMGSTVQRVRCDRPFIFMLRESHSESILFAGRMTNPELALAEGAEKHTNAQPIRRVRRSGV